MTAVLITFLALAIGILGIVLQVYVDARRWWPWARRKKRAK